MKGEGYGSTSTNTASELAVQCGHEYIGTWVQALSKASSVGKVQRSVGIDLEV